MALTPSSPWKPEAGLLRAGGSGGVGGGPPGSVPGWQRKGPGAEGSALP